MKEEEAACWEVCTVDGRGRGLFARRDIAGGEAVLSETALAAVVLEEWSSTVCHQCFRQVARISGCPKCKQVGWCSNECASAGEAVHARRWGSCCECDALRKLNADILNEGDVALAKLFVKLLCRRAVESEAGGGVVGAVDSQLKLLESNEEAMSDDRLSDLAMISEVVLDALPPAAHIEQEMLEGYMCAEQASVCLSISLSSPVCVCSHLYARSSATLLESGARRARAKASCWDLAFSLVYACSITGAFTRCHVNAAR